MPFKPHSPITGRILRPLLSAALLTAALTASTAPVSAAAFRAAEPGPAPATIESALTGPHSVTLYWSPPADGHPASYRVLRDGKLWEQVPASVLRLTDDSAAPGSILRFQVEAVYPDGKTVASHAIVEKLPPNLLPESSYDVVVTTASSAGVAAAVMAARKGLKVALLEPTDRLGGIMSNGLCSTDIRRPPHATGFFEEFSQRVKEYYGGGDGLRYEPHVVNNILKEMVAAESHIDLFLRVQPTGTLVEGDTVVGVRARSLDTGKTALFRAAITIDADPTGDVTAWAGCRCRVGREPRSAEEPHAGVIYYWRAKDVLLPGSTGRGDNALMAYAYLLVTKDYGPGADHTIPKPPGYRKEDYTHSPDWKDSWAYTSGAMPGSKYELNQHPQGNDLQKVNWRWPIQSPKERQKVEKLFRNHALGYLYYIQTELGKSSLGLPDDEFPENGGFPETLYVREARRVVGMTSLTEHDVTLAADRLRPDAGGIGDYPMDSHAVEPKTNWTTHDMGEGEYWLYRYTPWYQIPIGVVIPVDREGLLVAEAVSATHVGLGTLRLEPVRMELGELCAELAWLSVRCGMRPREVPPSMAQDALMWDGQRIFFHADVSSDTSHAAAIGYLGAHGFWPAADLKPDESVSRGEAVSLLKALQWMEAKQSGDAAMLDVVRRTRWTEPANPASPLTRGDMALWLAQTQASLRADWTEPQPVVLAPGVTKRQTYSDLNFETPVGRAALILWQHFIRADSWKGTHFTPGMHPLFDTQLPITRADFAQVLFLAQRDFPGPFFAPILPVLKILPVPPRVP